MKQGDRDLIERLMDVLSSDHKRGCDGRTYTCNCGYDDQVEQIADQATDRLQALSAEVERLKEALKRCGEIVENNLYRQHEKIEDVPLIVAQALKGDNNG